MCAFSFIISNNLLFQVSPKTASHLLTMAGIAIESVKDFYEKWTNKT